VTVAAVTAKAGLLLSPALPGWPGGRLLAILSAPGATLRGMDTLSDIRDTSYELPLSESDQAALRPALLRDLGAMRFTPGALNSRSLWVIFIGEWEPGPMRCCPSMTASACRTMRTSLACAT
jgi:hypothetical protein